GGRGAAGHSHVRGNPVGARERAGRAARRRRSGVFPRGGEGRDRGTHRAGRADLRAVAAPPGRATFALVRGHVWLKALAVVVLALSGASTAWTAVGRENANAPITGVRPTWSPDGKQIAYSDVVGSTVNGSWAILVMNADGTGRRQLVAGSLY